MRLNLGCGSKPLEGYVNVDALPGHDLQHDLRERLPYADGSASDIYAQHLAEHFTPAEWEIVLADWVRVLRPGGTLTIECPDMLKVCESFLFDRYGLRWCCWHQVLFGEDGPGMAHRQGFTIQRLRDELEAHGMKIVRARNWHDDHPDHINDSAWHYNLRVEAVKP